MTMKGTGAQAAFGIIRGTVAKQYITAGAIVPFSDCLIGNQVENVAYVNYVRASYYNL